MIQTINISNEDVAKILTKDESHFLDFKSRLILPSKLTITLSAFANTDGGEVYVGIENDKTWKGFANQEEANSLIQTIENFFPMTEDCYIYFLKNEIEEGLIVKIDVLKNKNIKETSDKKVYIRRSAQNLQLDVSGLERLKKNKGITTFENETVREDKTIIENSNNTIKFMLEVVPHQEPELWLKKQRLIINDLPTVAGVILFCDEPQTILPKSAIKIYQYKTDGEGDRDTLVFTPITVEGNAYDIIYAAVKKTQEIIQSIKIMTPAGLKSANYPIEALHEIITNAVIHRDYSINDDIHVRIYENRVEIQSPGTLPGHITIENILDERFSRNGAIVRLINKFPNPPNKDVGEGLNTAFYAMKKVRLKDPTIEAKGMNVIVTLKHESLGTPQSLIMNYLNANDRITNKEARQICAIESENTMKGILNGMIKANMIEKIEGQTVFQTAYKKK